MNIKIEKAKSAIKISLLLSYFGIFTAVAQGQVVLPIGSAQPAAPASCNGDPGLGVAPSPWTCTGTAGTSYGLCGSECGAGYNKDLGERKRKSSRRIKCTNDGSGEFYLGPTRRTTIRYVECPIEIRERGTEICKIGGGMATCSETSCYCSSLGEFVCPTQGGGAPKGKNIKEEQWKTISTTPLGPCDCGPDETKSDAE